MSSSRLYTKNGRPLKRTGDNLFSKSGTHVARIRGNRAYDKSGRYVGTVVGDRLVYRSTDSAHVSSSFGTVASSGFAADSHAGSAIWGDEPPIPD
jgi:hypothetical protein